MPSSPTTPDALPPLAARIELFRHCLVAIAEQMGETLARTAFSPNIKERRDHSCALFDAGGRLLAQAAHIPVHLGSMPDSVAAALQSGPLAPGDVIILNDPFRGGTHLPDLTLVTPVFDRERLIGLAANRAHHADVGGRTAASMGVSRHIDDEGIRLPPVKWFAAGQEQPELHARFLSRLETARERLGDLRAQLAANVVGARGLVSLVARHGAGFQPLCGELLAYGERLMRLAIAEIPRGDYAAADTLDGDGVSDRPIRIQLRLHVADGQVVADFAGTDPQVDGCVNCPLSVTRSAVAYVFACLAGPRLPHNAGMFAPLRVIAPPGCVVNAREPAAVAAGNVETSQRVVDVVLRALATALPQRVPAGSAGTMASVSLAGRDRRGRPFAYYETIGGGSGATPSMRGADAVHTHMTNTLNTPVEALESAYPLRVRRYTIRAGSGGGGAHPGGAGIVRELEALVDLDGALLADRTSRGGAGLRGGGDGQPFVATLKPAGGTPRMLPGKTNFRLARGDILTIETPGGGGVGFCG
ncbi:MAG: hydantoinase B/oxoprolinase family protein [Phycisphaerae bacterium]